MNTSQVTDHVWSLKFDHIFSLKRTASAYFQSLDSQLTYAVSDFNGPLGTALGNQYQKPQIFRVNHDYTFSPTILLHTHVWLLTHRARSGATRRRTVSRSKVRISRAHAAIPMPRPYIQFAAADAYTAVGHAAGQSQ